jgi:hypothetical protein
MSQDCAVHAESTQSDGRHFYVIFLVVAQGPACHSGYGNNFPVSTYGHLLAIKKMQGKGGHNVPERKMIYALGARIWKLTFGDKIQGDVLKACLNGAKFPGFHFYLVWRLWHPQDFEIHFEMALHYQ